MLRVTDLIYWEWLIWYTESDWFDVLRVTDLTETESTTRMMPTDVTCALESCLTLLHIKVVYECLFPTYVPG